MISETLTIHNQNRRIADYPEWTITIDHLEDQYISFGIRKLPQTGTKLFSPSSSVVNMVTDENSSQVTNDCI